MVSHSDQSSEDVSPILLTFLSEFPSFTCSLFCFQHWLPSCLRGLLMMKPGPSVAGKQAKSLHHIREWHQSSRKEEDVWVNKSRVGVVNHQIKPRIAQLFKLQSIGHDFLLFSASALFCNKSLEYKGMTHFNLKYIFINILGKELEWWTRCSIHYFLMFFFCQTFFHCCKVCLNKLQHLCGNETH